MKKLIYILAAAFALTTFNSCLDDELPQTDGAIADQIADADKTGLVNGLIQYLNTPNADYNDQVYTGLGYPEYMIWHDVMTQDLPILSTSYNYWTLYSECLYIGNWANQSYYWWWYNAMIYKAGLAIQYCQRGNEADALNYATALAYRAFTYFEMTRMYEYKKTGVSELDDQYYDKLKGLTVPIVNENSTEETAKNNPRAPFYQMYRYILNDLTLAQEAIELTSATGPKNFASPGMVYGLMARFWLELGSRFERYPDDLAEQIAHDEEQYPMLGEGYQNLPPIGIKTAKAAYTKAAQYARMAINCGYAPLSESDWYDKTTGFNTANSSWMWAILISASDKMVTDYDWESWVGFMCPEVSWGIASPEYRGSFTADAKLFNSISNKDWRKPTWIDPADWIEYDEATVAEQEQFQKTFESKYAPNTNLSFDDWRKLGPYTAIKFHPGNGNTKTSTTGNKVDIPLMRVEEMYLIEAEALAHSVSLAAGVTALNDFVNNYRMTDGSYKFMTYLMRSFEAEIVRQKRIEFWGEGVVLFDYRRLELPIERGYDGSNHPKPYQFNSLEGYVAPWTTLYIPLSERQQNPALVLNPDPSSIMVSLKYNN